MSTDAIVIAGLHRAYRRRGLLSGLFGAAQNAVCGVDLTIARGQSWALVGPNGAGKTTTLHCLVGLLRPDAGSVTLFGASPSLPATRARVGFQSEIFFAYPGLSIGTCMQLHGALAGVDAAVLPQQVAAALARTGLGGLAARRCGSLSKGMTARLGLAQSLLGDPELLIWDEPTSGLDPEGRKQVADLVAAHRAQGKTILLSTHILPDIERLCDHVAILYAGRIICAGNIATLREASQQSLEDLYLSTIGSAHAV